MADNLQKNSGRRDKQKLLIKYVICPCGNNRAFVTANYTKCTRCRKELEHIKKPVVEEALNKTEAI